MVYGDERPATAHLYHTSSPENDRLFTGAGDSWLSIKMNLGTLIIRLALFVVFGLHGVQKLTHKCGGSGPRGAAEWFASIGFLRANAVAWLAGLTEIAAACLLAIGLLTPLACLGIEVVMLNALFTTHVRNGFWADDDGIEFPLALLALAAALSGFGSGRWGLDHAFGVTWLSSGNLRVVVVFVAALLISSVTLGLLWRPASASADESAS